MDEEEKRKGEQCKIDHPGCEAMMISAKNAKEKYGLSTGPDIKDVVPYKLFPIQEVVDEYTKIGFYSDFFNFKASLNKYPEGEEVLVLADPEEVYGQNWIICVTVVAKDRELQAIKDVVAKKEAEEQAKAKAIADAIAAKEAEEAAIRNAVYVEVPIVIRPWVSETEPTTTAEIEQGNVFRSRSLFKVSISRKRKEFASNYKFNERDAETIAGAGPMEIRQSKDPNFELKRRVRDIGLQDCASWTATYLQIEQEQRAAARVEEGGGILTGTATATTTATTTSTSTSNPSSKQASPRAAATTTSTNQNSPRGLVPTQNPYDAVHENIPRKTSIGSQTRFFSKRNNATQFVDAEAIGQSTSSSTTSSGTSPMSRSSSPRSSPRGVGGGMVGGDGGMSLSSFLKTASRIIEESLQQNETVDIFRGDFSSLKEDEGLSFGSRSENTLPELRTFTDLTFSKNKILKSIDWHPTSKKIVAVSCVDNVSFDEKVSGSGRATKAYVLIWNFSDLIHPQLVLQSPQEVQCFRINPTNPNLIAGGTTSGQIVLWDITEAMGAIKSSASSSRRKGEEEDEQKQLPPLQPTHVTTIDNSHRRPVNDLCWLPDYMEISHRGATTYNEDTMETNQFATIAGDGQFMVWDIRFQEIAKKKAAQRNDKKQSENEIEWNPHFRTTLNKLDGVGELGLRKLSIEGKTSGSHFFAATEEGEFVDADWAGASNIGGGGDEEEGAPSSGDATARLVRAVNQDHFRPCVSLQRSPFFSDIYLSVGDWSFNIWCEGVEKPVFSSPFSEAYLTCGRWSPTRPGVIVLSRADGVVDIWDLTDQSHKPSMSAPIAQKQITSMEFADAGPSNPGGIQLLAAGDASGNLHILEMPRPLRRSSPNEKTSMRSFFDREVQRVNYVAQCQRERDLAGEEEEEVEEVKEMDAKSKKKEERAEMKKVQAQLKKEEEEYRKLEAKYREELGVSPGSPMVSPPGSPVGSDGGKGKMGEDLVDSENVSLEIKEGEKMEA